MQAFWNRITGRYEIEFKADELGAIKAALGFAGDSTGDRSFNILYNELRSVMDNASEKED